MSGPNHSEELENIVNQMLSKSPNEQFKRCWELYKETAYISDPKGIYLRISQDATYRNLAIAGDTGVVDIEADENNSDDRGISVSPYRTFSAIIFRLRPIPTLPRTLNSLLTVAGVVGGSSYGPYWSAHSEDEVKRLRIFAGILAKEISHQRRGN